MGMFAPDGPPGLPPGMMGGPPGPPPGMMGGPPGPPPGPGPEGPDGGGDSASFLRDVIDHLSKYNEVEKDDEDLAAVAQVISRLRQILAKQQREQDQAFGAGPAAKVLRRMN